VSGEDEKNDRRRKHAGCRGDMGIGTTVDSKDLSSDFNKSKCKNEKMAGINGRINWKLLLASPSKS